MIFIISGPIGSGKSTWAKTKAQTGAIVVNDDAIVTALHGGDYKLYNKTLKPLYKSVEQSIISTALCMGKDVVIDRINPTRESRRHYFSLANKFDVDYRLVLFDWVDPQVSAKARYEADARGYTSKEWLEVANKHFKLYEEPILFSKDKIIRISRHYV